MDDRTLKALKGSIAKWERIVDGSGTDQGIRNCPLCQLFHDDLRDDEEPGCQGCPVAEQVGDICCNLTPYTQFVALSARVTGGRVAHTPEARAAAQAELDFLKGLLPPE